jgi:hypothetical protein
MGGFAEENEFMEIICKDCHSVLCWQRVAARLGLSLLVLVSLGSIKETFFTMLIGTL